MVNTHMTHYTEDEKETIKETLKEFYSDKDQEFEKVEFSKYESPIHRETISLTTLHLSSATRVPVRKLNKLCTVFSVRYEGDDKSVVHIDGDELLNDEA